MEDVLTIRDAYREQNWTTVIQECRASGLSNREFCRQRGISEKSFYYWLKKLRARAVEAVGPQIVRLNSAAADEELLQIRYRGAELTLPASVDIDAVSGLLRSIQSL